MDKLPIDFKTKWVAALRSGEYKQTDGKLYRSGFERTSLKTGYCCLGVACIVAGYPKEELAGLSIIPQRFYKVPAMLCGGVGERYAVQALTNLNDMKNYSFNQIADYIEQNY